MFLSGWPAPRIPFVLVSAAPGSRRRFACDLGGDLFYPQSILFQSVNLECARAAAVRVSEIAQGSNAAGVYVFVLRRASADTRLNEERRRKKKKRPSNRLRLGEFWLESLRRENRLHLFFFMFFFFHSQTSISTC